MRKTFFHILGFLFLLVILVSGIWLLLAIFFESPHPAIGLTEPNAEYQIIEFGNTYYISISCNNELGWCGAYITSSDVDLSDYLNKPIRITGEAEFSQSYLCVGKPCPSNKDVAGYHIKSIELLDN